MKYKILSNEKINDNLALYDMRVLAPDVANSAQPGQIAHLYCGEGTTLRRPISICDSDKASGIITFCYEVRGKGTAYLANLKACDELDILAPYGHGFAVDESAKKILLIGGGIGIYPLLTLAGIYKEKATALFGFRTANLINKTDAFANYGSAVKIITDDGSSGKKGFVTELLKEEIALGGVDIVYVCGPKPMMKAAAMLCEDAKIRCQVSMEEHMACGVGACLGCVCKTMFVDNGEKKETYKRVCVDGPVFESSEIIW